MLSILHRELSISIFNLIDTWLFGHYVYTNDVLYNVCVQIILHSISVYKYYIHWCSIPILLVSERQGQFFCFVFKTIGKNFSICFLMCTLDVLHNSEHGSILSTDQKW